MTGPFPCPNPPSPCETSPNPVTGFSSEAADSTTFIGLAWNGNPPPLNKPFNLVPCEAIAESQVSQADADRIAQNAAVACSSPCTQPFQNTAQTASGQCPDGSAYSLTIPAGQYTAANQVLADRLAFTAAAQTLRGHSICLGSLAPSTVCRGEFYFGQISVVTTDGPAITQLVAGELPEGLSLQLEADRVVIQGTAAAFGTAAFTLISTSAVGVVTSKTYSVSVAGIVTSSPLSDGTQGDAYTTQLQAVIPPGATSVWSVVSGALPDGLVLDGVTGDISGTPAGTGTSNFTIAVTTSGNSCSKEFSLHIASSGPPPVACIADTGLTFNVEPGGTPDSIIVNTKTAAVRRMVVIDSSTGKAIFINTATNAVIASPAIGAQAVTGVAGSMGDLFCFATSVQRFYIVVFGGGVFSIDILDQNGTVTGNIPSGSYTFAQNLVYSPDQDKLYTIAFNGGSGTQHLLEIDPHTNAITNDVDTGSGAFGVVGYYKNNLIVTYPGSSMENYSLPGIAHTAGTGFFQADGEFDYDPDSNRIFVCQKNFADNPMVSINPATMAVDKTYSPVTNMDEKFFVKYNPVTKAIIACSLSGQITVIDPATQTIVCETATAVGGGSSGGFEIDYSSGEDYLFNADWVNNPIYVFD